MSAVWDELATDTVKRDRWGRPLIIPPGGGKPVPYTRATTFIKALDDMQALMKWHGRMVALGLAERPDLQLAVTAHRDDKTKLNGICEEAKEAARASAAATTGTALHALTERVDRGDDLGNVPAAFMPDLDAYVQATANLSIRPVDIERFVVCDEHKVGGTPDRIVTVGGRRYIFDLKTGEGQMRYGVNKIAMQLAVYAHSQAYDPATGSRSSLGSVDQRNAIIAHLPAGTGVCTLHWVDIRAGWEAVQLAAQVREWRGRKGLTKEWT